MKVLVGFSTTRKWSALTALIRLFTRARTSHSFFLISSLDWGMDLVVEASVNGFSVRPYGKFLEVDEVLGLYAPKHDISAGLRQLAQEYFGTPYDYRGFLGMGWVKLGQWLRRRWRNPLASDRALICSEAIVRAMLLSPGYEKLLLDPERADPETLRRFFESGEDFRILEE